MPKDGERVAAPPRAEHALPKPTTEDDHDVMALPARSTNGGFFWRRKKTPRLSGVLTATELEREFERERARVDRNSHCFSVCVFLPETPDDHDLERLSLVLKKRIRTPDVIGWLDTERLAVLLPETDAEGAWCFADDVTRKLSELKLEFDCLVHTYPADPDGDDGEPRSRSEAASRPAARSSEDADAEDEQTTRKPAARKKSARKKTSRKPRLVEDDERRDVACEELADVRRAAGRPVLDMSEHFTRRLPIWKRTLDIVVSATLLVALLPLFAVVAVLVRYTSPGPVIFKQTRAGLGGKPFTIYKFRSMYVDAEERRKELEDQNELDGPAFKIKDDPRMSPIGRILRRTSIDELPQLYNVLIGDMTLVGPRPPMLHEIANYEQWQLSRLDLTGGLTCIWQVSGRSEIGFEDWIRMDLRYVKERNFLMDIGLLGKTAKAVISGRGAY